MVQVLLEGGEHLVYIIKPGNIKNNSWLKAFRCSMCGCIFTATEKEYHYDHFGDPRADCPCCGHCVDNQIYEWEELL